MRTHKKRADRASSAGQGRETNKRPAVQERERRAQAGKPRNARGDAGSERPDRGENRQAGGRRVSTEG